MKHIKRALCAALCLALCCAMGVFAAAEEAADPYAPVITQQPQRLKFVLNNGTDSVIFLEVQARLPDGVKGEISYAWYDAAYPQTLIETAPKLAQSTAFLIDRGFSNGRSYYVIVTNTYSIDGVERTASTRSNNAEVIIGSTFGYAMSKPFIVALFSLPFLPLHYLFRWLGDLLF